MAQWDARRATRLVGITRGVEVEVDLGAFGEPAPTFACVDDTGAGVEALHGIEVVGRITVEGQPPYLWLQGPRDCVLLRATAEGVRAKRGAFRARAVGEFCLEVYRVRPDRGVELLGRGEFCFK